MADLKFTRQELISLCRLCLAKDLASIDIFETGSEVRQLFTKIVACLPIHITTGDSLPHKICEVCNSKVDDFYQFWTRTAQNQKQLNEWFQLCTDDDQKTIVPTIKVEADDTRQDEEYDDYDDGGQGDDSDDDEDAPSAAKRIKTQDSGDEDQKPTDLDAILENSTDVNGQKDGSSKKKAKEKQSSVHCKDEESGLKSQKSKRKYKCEVCGNGFRTGKECRRHTRRVHFNIHKTFECEFCVDRFSSANKLKKHMNTKHPKEQPSETFLRTINKEPKKNEPQDTGDYTLEEWNELVASKSKECPVCHKTYTRAKGMRRHLREVHSSNKRFVCDICGKQYSSSDRVNQHRKKLHFGINNPIEKKFECHHCNLKFSSKFFVSEHINTHTGYKPYTCPICNKTYGNVKSFKSHMKRHRQQAGQLKPEEMYPCNICNKVFLENSRLMKHHAWVHGDKYHECKICGAKLKGSVQKHMLSHTGEKPFCCHICGKSLKGNLQDHMLIHTGERPFKCSVCGSSFKDKWYLGVHMRKHSGEKPYECEFCGQTFAARSSYTSHLKKHEDKDTTGKSFTCQICKLKFVTEVDLTSHYSEHFVCK